MLCLDILSVAVVSVKQSRFSAATDNTAGGGAEESPSEACLCLLPQMTWEIMRLFARTARGVVNGGHLRTCTPRDFFLGRSSHGMDRTPRHAVEPGLSGGLSLDDVIQTSLGRRALIQTGTLYGQPSSLACFGGRRDSFGP